MADNTSYSQKLRNPKWQRKRLEILQRDDFKCTKCGDTETELQIHHLKYTGEPWNAPNENLITVCKPCHWILEFGKENSINYHTILKEHDHILALSDYGITFFDNKNYSNPEFKIGFVYNSVILKQMYNLSIK